jgi:hypothetical protein
MRLIRGLQPRHQNLTSGAFLIAFKEGRLSNQLRPESRSVLVAKVEAVGPASFRTDIGLLENRFQFERRLRGLRDGKLSVPQAIRPGYSPRLFVGGVVPALLSFIHDSNGANTVDKTRWSFTTTLFLPDWRVVKMNLIQRFTPTLTLPLKGERTSPFPLDGGRLGWG